MNNSKRPLTDAPSESDPQKGGGKKRLDSKPAETKPIEKPEHQKPLIKPNPRKGDLLQG